MLINDKLVRKFKDTNGNIYKIFQKKNKHYYLIINEKNKNFGKIIEGSKNYIFSFLKDIHKTTNFINL